MLKICLSNSSLLRSFFNYQDDPICEPFIMFMFSILLSFVGFGLALVRNATLTIIGFYVKRRIGLAYGFVAAGSNFGLLFLSPVFTVLIKTYSWRGAMLVISGIMANQCVTGALYRKTSSEATANATKSGPVDHTRPDEQSSTETTQRAFFGYLSIESKRKPSIGARIRKTSSEVALGIRRTSIQVADGITRSNTIAILKNVRMVSFNVAVFLRGFGFFASMVHFVALCIDNDISLSKSALLLSVIGISGAAVSLTHGIVLDKKLITPLQLLSLSLLTAGVSCILIAIWQNFPILVAFSILFGATSSIFHAVTPSGIRQILDVDVHLIKGSLGLAMTVAAAGGLIGIPIMGKF